MKRFMIIKNYCPVYFDKFFGKKSKNLIKNVKINYNLRNNYHFFNI